MILMTVLLLLFAVTADLPDDSANDVLLSATKLYIVIGCIVALVLVAIIQAGCTIYRTAKSPSPHHKVGHTTEIFLT